MELGRLPGRWVLIAGEYGIRDKGEVEWPEGSDIETMAVYDLR
jgi:hypothetical protein